MKGRVRGSGPYLVVGRPSGVTVTIQRSVGDRTIVEHIDHLSEYVEDNDDPLTSCLTNDLPVDNEVNIGAERIYQSFLLTNFECRIEMSVLWGPIARWTTAIGRLPMML